MPLLCCFLLFSCAAPSCSLQALAIDPEHAASLLGMANLLADVRGDTMGSATYYERALVASNQDYNDADVPLKIGRRKMLDAYRCYAVFKHRVAGDFEESLQLLKSAMAIPTPRTDKLSKSECLGKWLLVVVVVVAVVSLLV
jgi:hypothetical protein